MRECRYMISHSSPYVCVCVCGAVSVAPHLPLSDIYHVDNLNINFGNSFFFFSKLWASSAGLSVILFKECVFLVRMVNGNTEGRGWLEIGGCGGVVVCATIETIIWHWRGGFFSFLFILFSAYGMIISMCTLLLGGARE